MEFSSGLSRHPAGSSRTSRLASTFLVLLALPICAAAQTPAVARVQHTGKDAGTTTSSFLAFPNPNTSGNWIAVCIRAGHTGETFTVTDTNGNLYHPALTLNVTADVPNGDSLAIFYAENIAAGPNTVTVSDNLSSTLRFAILEYSGIATTNSIDAVAAAQGISASPNSGAVATSASGNLLLGAIVTGDPENFTAGAGYTIDERVPTTNSKLMVEDATQGAPAPVVANASLGYSAAWGAALAAFRPANSAGVLPASISVAVAPVAPTIAANASQQFTATVQNDASNLGVSWTLSGSGCVSAACGTLSSPATFSVIYTAPPVPPVPATITVTATSVTDTTKSASVTVTITAPSLPSSQGIPTSLGWFQIPNTMLQPVCPNTPQIQGAIGCQGVIAAWSGGIADTKRNRLLFTGGGHQNYWGNEVYSLNLTDLTLTRLNNPVFPSGLPSCSEDWGAPPLVPSTPAPRENYSGLAYVAHLDKLWLFGGALATSGCRSSGMWMLDLPTLSWQRMDPANGAQETSYTDINYADYDALTKLVYVYIANNDVLAAYNPDTNTMTELLNHNSYGVSAYANGVLDPKRHQFVVLGGGFAGSYDLTASPPVFARFSSQTLGCGGLQSANYPGLAYDPAQDKIVGWAGGNTVYLFDLPTRTCTAVTYPGGPAAQQPNGTYGRWRYFPNLNLFALVNDWKQNAFTLRLTPAP
jgi:hypothetical protein